MQSYVGIGVIYDGLTGLIETASPLYPAAQAGIRVGDILRDDLRHTAPTVGQLLQVHIERDGQLLTFSIRAVRICFKVKQP
jgi:predicted metalloprotease with PDZ domain